MLTSHRRAMGDSESCRAETLGGHVYLCPHCERKLYSYHSCKNRHCPKCQGEAAREWLDRQQDLRLPVPYFLLTFTMPEGLRRIARRNQKTIYNLLFRASAAATQQLAQDHRFVVGRIGMIGGAADPSTGSVQVCAGRGWVTAPSTATAQRAEF